MSYFKNGTGVWYCTMYSVASQRQRSMLMRGVMPDIQHEHCFATMDWGDGFRVEFRKIFTSGTVGPYNLEMDVKRDDHKVVLWLDVVDSVNVRNLVVFGLKRTRPHVWSSVVLTYPEFTHHLAAAKQLVQETFERIDCTAPVVGWRPNTVRDDFMQSMAQYCGGGVRDILSSAVRVRRARRSRCKKMIRNAWTAWIEHYYDPDTPNGYMETRAHVFYGNVREL